MRRKIQIKFAYCLYLALCLACNSQQQLGDSSFVPNIETPTFEIGKGPVVKIDEAHHNFHTMDGRYLAFAEVLRHDGYRVEANTSEFNLDSLRACSILVISNALNERNIEDWSLPTPSAFTDEEIEVVRKWVEDGGALFLIADHMPFPGAAQKLAAAFGFEFSNGFAFDTLKQGRDIFRRSDGSLRAHKITDGKDPSGRVDSVASFTGQAFKANRDHQPVIVFDSNYVVYLPEIAWEFDEKTEILPIAGWMQAAATRYGEGRVFVSGEAAMFSSQVAGGGSSFGLTSPEAAQNLLFLRNIMCWLSGCFD
ncbi:MAG: DUF4350 domain-containing protein [Candidatus Zixiibacteriota bacterium]|nr:MAG: DUF4350 domain-containing protein [candidate division Zixibacteria bacterium]